MTTTRTWVGLGLLLFPALSGCFFASGRGGGGDGEGGASGDSGLGGATGMGGATSTGGTTSTGGSTGAPAGSGAWTGSSGGTTGSGGWTGSSGGTTGAGGWTGGSGGTTGAGTTGGTSMTLDQMCEETGIAYCESAVYCYPDELTASTCLAAYRGACCEDSATCAYTTEFGEGVVYEDCLEDLAWMSCDEVELALLPASCGEA